MPEGTRRRRKDGGQGGRPLQVIFDRNFLKLCLAPTTDSVVHAPKENNIVTREGKSNNLSHVIFPRTVTHLSSKKSTRGENERERERRTQKSKFGFEELKFRAREFPTTRSARRPIFIFIFFLRFFAVPEEWKMIALSRSQV